MSTRRLDFAIALLALIGLAVASYLTYVHYAGIKPLCLASGGCEQVQSSRYAKVGGVPVAVLGLVGYAGILASLWIRGELGRAMTACLALVGFGFSAYLTYREVFTIKAICQWCVGSAVVMTALAVLAVARLLLAGPTQGAPASGMAD
ncbi:MAG: hypothetical protein QOI98_1556 [Solirubrobacteraceae bacterium]|jgi:uncharacterized membrane protein|nr:hypothetical protein [Solirubrobacteraceae bacterium]